VTPRHVPVQGSEDSVQEPSAAARSEHTDLNASSGAASGLGADSPPAVSARIKKTTTRDAAIAVPELKETGAEYRESAGAGMDQRTACPRVCSSDEGACRGRSLMCQRPGA
jgi:hypothetical protein